MHRAPSKPPKDPFDGLRLPVSVWKALEDAQITNLTQLKELAPQLDQIQCIGPEAAQSIRDRLDRLAARRTVQVRLIFPKQTRRKKEGSS